MIAQLTKAIVSGGGWEQGGGLHCPRGLEGPCGSVGSGGGPPGLVSAGGCGGTWRGGGRGTDCWSGGVGVWVGGGGGGGGGPRQQKGMAGIHFLIQPI